MAYQKKHVIFVTDHDLFNKNVHEEFPNCKIKRSRKIKGWEIVKLPESEQPETGQD